MHKPAVVVVGSANIDMVVSAERFAAPGETLTATGFQLVAGGKGANQAVAAARLGSATRLISRVGEDSYAEMLYAALTDAGVELGSLRSVVVGTGTALITTVPGGQNTILVFPGANAQLRPSDIDREWTYLAAADVVLTQLEIPVDTVEHLAQRCNVAGIPLVLDPAPVQTLSSTLTQHVAWLTPNEAETLGLTGVDITGADEAELRSVAASLLNRGTQGVVLKLGARGAYIATRDTYRWIHPFPVEAVDTTAAGDAFNGAFAAMLAQGSDPFNAGRVACAAAALSTRKAGAIPSMPTQAEVEALLASA